MFFGKSIIAFPSLIAFGILFSAALPNYFSRRLLQSSDVLTPILESCSNASLTYWLLGYLHTSFQKQFAASSGCSLFKYSVPKRKSTSSIRENFGYFFKISFSRICAPFRPPSPCSYLA